MVQIPTTYDDLIWLMCRRHFRGVHIDGQPFDMRWIKAQIMAESAFKPGAVSPAGARGLMQLMPGTSRDLARQMGMPDSPFDPYINIAMGVRYDRMMWGIFKREKGKERLRFMFGAYNAGVGNIIKAQMRAEERGLATDKWESIKHTLASVTGRHARETVEYVARIGRYYKMMQTEAR